MGLNPNRVVPITKIDLLTLIATVMALIGTAVQKLASATVLGDFSVTGSGAVGNLLADQPVRTLDIGSGVTSATVYFVPDYNFTSITVNGAAATISDSGVALDAVPKDGVSLYKAVYADSAVTITAVTITV